MSGVVNDVAAYLVAQGVGVLDSTLHRGFLPATPDVCCAVISNGGQPPDMGFGTTAIVYQHPTLQLVFRGVPFDYTGPETRIFAAWRLVAALLPGVLPGVSGSDIYQIFTPMQQPFPTERDARQRCVFSVNFLVDKE